ncbi:MAG: hypothetical protein U0X20_12165 [Caldilineaceae bacterium]
MSTYFDQRGQTVNYQYNAAGNINFGAVQNQMNVVGELEKLHTEVRKAAEANVLDGEIATDVKYYIEKAEGEAKKTEPNKRTIIDHLNQAKLLIAGVTAAAGLVTGLSQAIEAINKLF